VAFLSDYSEEYAVAYYQMSEDEISAPGKPYKGKSLRTKVGTVELSYMVRSAAGKSAVGSADAQYYSGGTVASSSNKTELGNWHAKGWYWNVNPSN
jgi:hypothetical protein